MGDPKKTRKHFKRPLKIWDNANIAAEKALKESYGLKNKREIWRVETFLRKKRDNARSLLALPLEERLKREKELLQSLARLGILTEKAGLDDVLTLTIESFLERRLQTILWRKGLANTAKQARQFIVHGLVAVNGRRVTAPSYLVSSEDESKIGYYAGRKMVLRPPVLDKKKAAEGKKKIADEFEAAKPAEGQEEGGTDASLSPDEAMKLVRAARNKAGAGSEEAEEGGVKGEGEKKEGAKGAEGGNAGDSEGKKKEGKKGSEGGKQEGGEGSEEKAGGSKSKAGKGKKSAEGKEEGSE